MGLGKNGLPQICRDITPKHMLNRFFVCDCLSLCGKQFLGKWCGFSMLDNNQSIHGPLKSEIFKGGDCVPTVCIDSKDHWN